MLGEENRPYCAVNMLKILEELDNANTFSKKNQKKGFEKFHYIMMFTNQTFENGLYFRTVSLNLCLSLYKKMKKEEKRFGFESVLEK